MSSHSALTSRRMRVRLAAGLALPLIAFLVLRQAIGNATGALAITDAIPLVWLLAFGIWRRRIEPVGLVALGVFAVALAVTIATGGSALPLELRRSVFPGAVGLACLISLAIRRPLLVIASARVARARPDLRRGRAPLDTPAAGRVLTTLTAIIGVTFSADAAAQIVLALTLSTASFAELARVASYVTIGGGLAVAALYLRWARAQLEPS